MLCAMLARGLGCPAERHSMLGPCQRRLLTLLWQCDDSTTAYHHLHAVILSGHVAADVPHAITF